MPRHRRRLPLAILIAFLALTAAGPAAAAPDEPNLGGRLRALWDQVGGKRLPQDIVSTNGRIEAEQVLVAAKLAGRVAEVLASEGQTVDAGAVVARMDTSELEAPARRRRRAGTAREKAIAEADAAIVQRDAERVLARQEHERAATLKERGYGTEQQLDLRQSQLNVAEAAHRAALAGLDEAQAAADAARADVARIRSLLDDPC